MFPEQFFARLPEELKWIQVFGYFVKLLTHQAFGVAALVANTPCSRSGKTSPREAIEAIAHLCQIAAKEAPVWSAARSTAHEQGCDSSICGRMVSIQGCLAAYEIARAACFAAQFQPGGWEQIVEPKPLDYRDSRDEQTEGLEYLEGQKLRSMVLHPALSLATRAAAMTRVMAEVVQAEGPNYNFDMEGLESAAVERYLDFYVYLLTEEISQFSGK